MEQKKRENLRVKATEDRKKAEEEVEEEAIVQKKAKEVDIFDQLPTAEEDERIDEAYDAANLSTFAAFGKAVPRKAKTFTHWRLLLG